MSIKAGTTHVDSGYDCLSYLTAVLGEFNQPVMNRY